MRNFKKAFITALVTGAALSASADVFAQRGPGRGGRDGRDISRDDFRGDRRFGNGHRNRGATYSVESEFIGKTFFPGERLMLGRELGLRQHRGKEVEKVELEIEGMRRGGSMSLYINGQQVSRTQQFYGGRVGDQVISFNLHRPFVIGENLQRIQVEINGTAYVREALVVLKNQRGGGHGPRNLSAHLHEDVIGQGELKVSDLVNANFRQEEMATRFVEIEFQSFARANQIRLCQENSFGFVRPVIDHGFTGRPQVDFDFREPRGPRGPGRGRPGRDHSMRCENTQLVQGNGSQRLRIMTNGKTLKDLTLMIRGDLTLKKITVGLGR